MNMRRQHITSQALSPRELCEIIARFGARRCATLSTAGAVVANCRATASFHDPRLADVPIDVRRLGFSQICFTGCGPFRQGASLVITLDWPEICFRRWTCEVVQSEALGTAVRRVLACVSCGTARRSLRDDGLHSTLPGPSCSGYGRTHFVIGPSATGV